MFRDVLRSDTGLQYDDKVSGYAISLDFDVSMFAGDGTGVKKVVRHSVDGIARDAVAGSALKANCNMKFFSLENLTMNLDISCSHLDVFVCELKVYLDYYTFVN